MSRDQVDDRHGGCCPACAYFDRLLQMGIEHEGAIEVIAQHIRLDHEPAGS